METAWREHMETLTLAELFSSAALQSHMLQQFQVKLVSMGLEHTAVGSLEDVHEMIAKIIRDSPMLDASAMSKLMNAQRAFFEPLAVKEVLDMAKEKSMEGLQEVECDLHKLQAFKPFMRKATVNKNLAAHGGSVFTIPTVVEKLVDLGYSVILGQRDVKHFCFTLRW